jgi:hypothetical protein
VGREARRNKGRNAARRLSARPFNPDEIRQILEAGNSAELCEFVGVKCLHSPRAGVMSLETYLQHRLDGCQPWRVSDNARDLTRSADAGQDSDGSRH